MSTRFLPFALLSILAVAAGSVRAQSPAGPSRHATALDLTGASGPTINYSSAAAWRLWGIDRGGRFQAGLGLRASYFFADANDYYSQNAGGGYGLFVPDPHVLALNAAFHLRARVAGPVRLGFNLDFAGLSFGPSRTGLVVGAPAGTAPERPQTRPVRENILLGGRPDRGSLNSETYVAVALPRNFGLRLGYSHIVTAYKSDFLAADAGRYHRFRNLTALGLSYTLP